MGLFLNRYSCFLLSIFSQNMIAILLHVVGCFENIGMFPMKSVIWLLVIFGSWCKRWEKVGHYKKRC